MHIDPGSGVQGSQKAVVVLETCPCGDQNTSMQWWWELNEGWRRENLTRRVKAKGLGGEMIQGVFSLNVRNLSKEHLVLAQMSCNSTAGKSVGARTSHISQQVNDMGWWSFEAEL